jgi:hypothetical protein
MKMVDASADFSYCGIHETFNGTCLCQSLKIGVWSIGHMARYICCSTEEFEDTFRDTPL